MIEFFLTTADEGTQQIDEPQPGCWINVVAPTVEERAWLATKLEIAPEFVRAAVDDDERAHVDYDDDTGQALIIMDCPFVEDEVEAEDISIVQYDTHPLAAIFLPRQDMIVTVSLRENPTVTSFAEGKVRHVNTNQRTRLLLQITLRVSQRYLSCLRSIDRQFRENERILRRTMSNRELIRMLGFEKSLVYFSTSLRSIEATLTRISQGRVIKLYEDDRDLLDDVFIEVRQAIEMCSITTNILNGTTETFSSVINNNLNLTMRTLTVITIVLSIPTIVFSFYGMNVGLPFSQTWLIPIAIALGCIGIAAVFFRSSHLFK